MTQPSAHQKTFISGLFNHPITRPTIPASPCPYCLQPGHTPDTGTLLQWRCPNGHEWCTTLKAAQRHAAWLNRLDTHRNGDL